MKLKSTLAMATLCLSGGVFAQVPQTERNVSMAMAQVIIAGAVEECAKTSYRVSVVIVDKAGQLAAALASGDRMALRQIPGVVAIGGGVPIRAGSETIGAIGVSGAPGGDKDEICAQAGIATVAAGLN